MKPYSEMNPGERLSYLMRERNAYAHMIARRVAEGLEPFADHVGEYRFLRNQITSGAWRD